MFAVLDADKQNSSLSSSIWELLMDLPSHEKWKAQLENPHNLHNVDWQTLFSHAGKTFSYPRAVYVLQMIDALLLPSQAALDHSPKWNGRTRSSGGTA